MSVWRVQAAHRSVLQRLGDLGPSILALLNPDPNKRMTIDKARTQWAVLLRKELVRTT